MGTYKNELKNEYGVQIWPEEITYFGNLINDKPHGKGRININNGDVYEGEFKDGMLNGFGKYTHASGVYYEGFWINNEKEGNGTEKWLEGSIYQGQFSRGLRHGKGKYITRNGSIYEGNWSEGKLIKSSTSIPREEIIQYNLNLKQSKKFRAYSPHNNYPFDVFGNMKSKQQKAYLQVQHIRSSNVFQKRSDLQSLN